MNVPVLLARDEGFFKDGGLNIDFVTTPGMAGRVRSKSAAVPRKLSSATKKSERVAHGIGHA